jgi:hypothetical protein
MFPPVDYVWQAVSRQLPIIITAGFEEVVNAERTKYE